jgi:Cu(I)/Ag(I) efflux system membrane fusion protein
MNSTLKRYSIGGLLVIVGIAIGALVFSSENTSEIAHEHASDEAESVWTCSMHPQIRQDEPGDCPICGMDLIQANQMQASIDPDAIKMSKTARALAKVETIVVDNSGSYTSNRSYSGQLVVNQDRVERLSANYSGRIEKLYVNDIGEQVRKGQVIAEIFAPELQIIQDEYKLALKQNNSSLLQSITRKIENLELSPAEVQNMNNGILQLKSPSSGYVTTLNVNQGENIKTDQALLEVANLSTLWAQFDIYESALNTLSLGDELNIDIPNQPGITGRISFISPVLDEKTRSAKARVVIDNTNNKLKPGIFISAELEDSAKMPSDTKESGLWIPKSAMLWSGKRSVVYQEIEDESGVYYKMKEVQTGKTTAEAIEVVSGISAGDVIVSQGAFSIDSEAQLADKPSMMNRRETAPAQAKSEVQLDNKFLQHYFDLKNALVNDDFENAKTIATDLNDLMKGETADMKNANNMKSILKDMLNQTSIDAFRDDFIQLSEKVIQLSKRLEIDQKLYVQYCPMADSNEGAYWLSLDESIRNPYFGASMLKCGEVREVIDARKAPSSSPQMGED